MKQGGGGGGEQRLETGLRTNICDGIISTSNFGDEHDRELIAKVTCVLADEGVSVSKAMAILDAARTAMLNRALRSTLP